MPANFPARLWLADSWPSRLLLPLALLHGGVLACRRFLYRARIFNQVRLTVPVIVVGNFFVGGTGKTPLVIALVDELRRLGWTPGVISRGYGGSQGAPCEVTAGVDPSRAGDEPVLIAERTGAPVVVCSDRALAGRALLSQHPAVDVIICDDGLQHLRLARDMEIAVYDGRGVGNGRLIPAGPLRESPRAVDLVVRNGETGCMEGGSPIETRMQVRPGSFYSLDFPQVRLGPEAFAGRRVVAIAGIGDPTRFFATLRKMGIRPDRTVPFPDHHAYAPADLMFDGADVVLMTEKDAVKCRGFPGRDRLYALRVDAALDPSPAEALRRCLGAPGRLIRQQH